MSWPCWPFMLCREWRACQGDCYCFYYSYEYLKKILKFCYDPKTATFHEIGLWHQGIRNVPGDRNMSPHDWLLREQSAFLLLGWIDSAGVRILSYIEAKQLVRYESKLVKPYQRPLPPTMAFSRKKDKPRKQFEIFQLGTNGSSKKEYSKMSCVRH